MAVTTGVVAWRRRAISVHTALVKRSDLLVRVLCDGRLEPPEGGELRTADGGMVAAIAVLEGDRVRRGQLLVRLANPDLEARARDARGQARQLQADAAAGGDELDRERREAAYRGEVVAGDRRLLAQGAIPRATLEADQLAWQQALDRAKEAEARLRAVQRPPAGAAAAAAGSGPGAAGSGSGSGPGGRGASRLALAEGAATQLERRVAALGVHAPADGVVYGLPRAAGEMVAAGQLVASVTDPDHPHVRCRVDQPDLPRVAPGQRLIVTFNGLPDRQWDGAVRRVGTGLRETGGREVGEIVGELADPVHTLPANAAVDVQVVVAQKRGALTVPRSALRRDGERYVHAVVNRRAHRREVTVGLIGLSEVEILTGLREGERVVAEGPPTLAEDTRVVEAKPQGP